ncbi:MAG: vanadium-dependent haloperoxidase [Alphaproteobacteria bacterium]
MPDQLKPVPSGSIRADIAKRVRTTAANISQGRAPYITQSDNGDLETALNSKDEYVSAVGTFTKGLPHDNYGRVTKTAIKGLVEALNQPHADPSQDDESPFPGVYTSGKPAAFAAELYNSGIHGAYSHKPAKGTRGWESPISGHTFDLQGCDADATGMPPAPKVGSAELTAEMAEVYCAALVRDVEFSKWGSGAVDAQVDDLAALHFFVSEDGLNDAAKKRRAARFNEGKFSAHTLFRGSTPGSMKGPYISQFMLVGNAERGKTDKTAPSSFGAQSRASRFGINVAGKAKNEPIKPEDGYILYGTQTIPQQFKPHMENVDHMTTWSSWRDVQNGANLKDVADEFEGKSRFISTPRDLATYVHFDALYQAYLNAVLILSGMGADTDIGFPEGGNTLQPERDAFATFGGPHILSLVTEVATRALKGVRRQKFNTHLRSRPEALAAAISLAWKGGKAAASLGPFQEDCDAMSKALEGILKKISIHNSTQNTMGHVLKDEDLDGIIENANGLLPMVFPEGSPMHAAYGAGHATVAGACVTVVKAFFEMFEIGDLKRSQTSIYDVVNKGTGYPGICPNDLYKKERLLTETGQKSKNPFGYNPLDTAFEADNKGEKLKPWADENLTIQGELDKLAANISIGRNFAGVHYYTDYYESLRMGERIAVSILQEQMLTYREPVSMRFNSFDGDRVMIAGTGGTRGSNDALVFIWDENGHGGTEADFLNWWNKHR